MPWKRIGTNARLGVGFHCCQCPHPSIADLFPRLDGYGVPLDTRHTDWAKSDWQIWTSAIVTDTNVRDMFISKVAKFAVGGQSTVPFSDWYNSKTGVDIKFKNR